MSARDLGLPEAVSCPFCDGLETELHAGFGGQLSVATYWCRRCRTVFEVFRGIHTKGERHGEAPARKKVPEAEK